jgi:alkylation response protein AidB-like acyl-CoA dehydrogenase
MEVLMIVDYDLTDEQIKLKALTRELAMKYIKPVARELDETEAFPVEPMKHLAKAGLFGVCFPKEYGGMGRSLLDFCLVTEELARIDGSCSTTFAASLLGSLPIMIGGTEEQKKKYLTDLASGKYLASFALSEPVAGSDTASIATTAVKKGDTYVLNGTKRFITNASHAGVISVIAKTDPTRGARGISSFIVEKDTPGMKVLPGHKKMGIRASATCNIQFKDVAVPVENLIGGKENRGFFHIMRTFEQSRPGVAAQAVGIAQGAFDLALVYSNTRKQFGKSINTYQGLQWMLADMEIQIEAARSLTYNSIRMVDRGLKDINAAAAAAKSYASDTAMKVTTDAVQIFGGWGYMRSFEVERFMRDAKVTQIYEGTNQIQRNIIALRLLKELQNSDLL